MTALGFFSAMRIMGDPFVMRKAGEVVTVTPLPPVTRWHTQDTMERTGRQACDGGPTPRRHQLCGSIFNSVKYE